MANVFTCLLGDGSRTRTLIVTQLWGLELAQCTVRVPCGGHMRPSPSSFHTVQQRTAGAAERADTTREG